MNSSGWYLEVDKDDTKIPLAQGITTVGRTPKCKIQLDSNFCSRVHCSIEVLADGAVKISDFSTNGTYVNGECYINMDIMVSEHDRIGIGWWPFDSVATKDVPIYTLRKEESPGRSVEPEGEQQQDTSREIAANIILISDDEDDNLDLGKYVSENKTNVPDEVQAPVADLLNMEVDDFSEPPQFLPAATKPHESINPPPSDVVGLARMCDAQFLPSATKPKHLIRNLDEMFFASEKPSTSSGLDEPRQNGRNVNESHIRPSEAFRRREESAEEMEVESLSQSTLLDIKREVADMDFEQSFDIKHDAPVKQEVVVNDAEVQEIGVVETSPIYIIDNDDEDEAEEMKFNNWVTKLSQSINSQKPMVRIHAQDENVSNSTVDNVDIDALSQQMRRSLSLDDIAPQFLDETKIIAQKEEKLEGKRETRQSRKRDDVEKDIEDSAVKDLPKRRDTEPSTRRDTDPSNRRDPEPRTRRDTDPSNRRDTEPEKSKDGETTTARRGIKHKSLGVEPVPSTSRVSMSSKESEYSHLEAKRKKPEVIEAPNLRTGRGKLRGHSATNKSSTRFELEKKIQSARISNQEKLMKDKWRQKPSLERHEEKVRLKSIHEQRKMKLKEMADEQAQKRKCEIDDNKVVKKPKVKVTARNRGAFLADELEAAKSEVHPNKIPKLLSRVSVDETKPTPENGVVVRRDSRSSVVEIDNGKPGQIKRTSERNSHQGESTRKSPTRRNSTRQSISEEKRPTHRRKANGLKSILKTGSSKRKNLSVSFVAEPVVIYFDIEEDNQLSVKVLDCKDAPTPTGNWKCRPNYSDEMINDILQWNPYWLGTELQEVNGPKHEPMMMVQKYQSYKEFANIVLPLFKLELWASIQRDLERRGSADFTLFKVISYSAKRNCILECETNIKSEMDKLEFTALQLCIIDFKTQSHAMQAFGIISGMRYYASNNSQHSLNVTIKLKGDDDMKSVCNEATYVGLKPVTNIRVEVGIYNAIKNLEFSPLQKCILDPYQLLQGSHLNLKNIKYKGYNKDLNPNQMAILLAAYDKCVDDTRANNLFLIEGPPGTGKSRIITNLALQTLYGSELKHLKRKKKILVCAQSNAAIDIIALKLMDIRRKMERDKFNLVRFGVLDRIHPDARCVSLQKLVQSQTVNPLSSADRDTLKNEKNLLEQQIKSLKQKANRNTVDIDNLKKRQEKLKWIDTKLFGGNATTGQEFHYPTFLAGAHIVCTTLSSCIKLLNYVQKFDVCIIDEATQCAEPYTLIPLQFGISSLILVGDTQQLPATVLSTEASDREFGRSLFTRIQNCIADEENCPIQLLKTQYRMHPEICMWPNSYFYRNILINHESTRQTVNIVKPYAVLSLEYMQDCEHEVGKLTNVNEAKFVVTLVAQLAQLMSPEYFSYGIITPYAQHKDYLQKKIIEAGFKRVLVNTIDSYQGKEKDIIIMSCVRTKGIGFLGNCQRLNVALTRARKCLFVCGNFFSLKREPVWNTLLEDAKRRNLFYHISPKDVADFDNKVMCHLRTNIATGTKST